MSHDKQCGMKPIASIITPKPTNLLGEPALLNLVYNSRFLTSLARIVRENAKAHGEEIACLIMKWLNKAPPNRCRKFHLKFHGFSRDLFSWLLICPEFIPAGNSQHST